VTKFVLASAHALALVCLLGLAACADEDGQGTPAPSPSPVTTAGPGLSPSPGVGAEAGPLGAYVVDVAGGEVTRLAAGEDYSVVSWSQDGTALTLAQGELTGAQDTYSVNADGSELTLTATIDGWVGPWSPATRAIIRYETGRDQSTGMVQYGLYVTSPGARLGRWVADGFLGVWSPDGERIAFVGNFCDEEQNYVGVVRADGSDLVKLTDVDSLQVGHAWSPDGRSLAFSAPDEEGALQIFLADVEGGTRVKLTDGPSSKMRPAWSADGAFLSFTALESEDPGAAPTYWVVPKEGGGAVPLPAGIGDLAWSPQGRQLAFTGGGELQVLDLEEGGEPTALARLGESDEVDFHWSPDGRRIAFIKEGQIYVVGIDGSGEKQLTSEATLQATGGSGEPVIIDSVHWSPGSTKIAFAVGLPSAARAVCS
jgi:Tol biopolymer transport system component